MADLPDLVRPTTFKVKFTAKLPWLQPFTAQFDASYLDEALTQAHTNGYSLERVSGAAHFHHEQGWLPYPIEQVKAIAAEILGGQP